MAHDHHTDHHHHDEDAGRAWSRRGFLKGGAALALYSVALGGTPLFLSRTAKASEVNGALSPFPRRRKTLVCLFQRGAMDGLAAVQPLEDRYLAAARPDFVLSAARGDDALLEMDGRFGLHPALAPLAPYFREGRLALVHGVGSPNATRSHFDAQDYMESGTPGRKGTPSGWLNRAVGLLGHEGTPFQAVATTPALPRSLYGDSYALAVEHLEDLKVRGAASTSVAAGASGFEALYRETSQALIQDAGGSSLDATRILEEAAVASIRPADGVRYPGTPLGTSLRQIAQLIKGGVGLEVAFAEQGGWDTHARQGGALGRFGQFYQRAYELARCIDAFWRDLGPMQQDVVLMTMTEFGRTVEQNGAGGTDHGRGSALFVLGDDVAGGEVYGSVPTLAPENLEDGRDLPVTTDFRSVFAGVAGAHLGLNDDAALFPGWTGERLELLRS
jgi:uncharacterized protein (DUF1501 family)